jgi:hypothetical protein
MAGSGVLETHTLVAGRHIPRYALFLRSLARHAPIKPVLHDDGSCPADATARLREEFPGLSVIARSEADERMAEFLAGFPLVRWWRGHNVRSLQLLDYFLLAGAAKVLASDSDVVVLRKPDVLLQWLAAPAAGSAVFAYSPEHGWEAKGIHWLPHAVPERPFISAMCCGFAPVQPAEFLDLGYLEDLIGRTARTIREQQRFVTQMYYSLMAGRLPAGRVLSLGEPYRSGRLEWLPDIPDRVICHYFGSHDEADGLQGVWLRHPGLKPELKGALQT